MLKPIGDKSGPNTFNLKSTSRTSKATDKCKRRDYINDLRRLRHISPLPWKHPIMRWLSSYKA